MANKLSIKEIEDLGGTEVPLALGGINVLALSSVRPAYLAFNVDLCLLLRNNYRAGGVAH